MARDSIVSCSSVSVHVGSVYICMCGHSAGIENTLLTVLHDQKGRCAIFTALCITPSSWNVAGTHEYWLGSVNGCMRTLAFCGHVPGGCQCPKGPFCC